MMTMYDLITSDQYPHARRGILSFAEGDERRGRFVPPSLLSVSGSRVACLATVCVCKMATTVRKRAQTIINEYTASHGGADHAAAALAAPHPDAPPGAPPREGSSGIAPPKSSQQPPATAAAVAAPPQPSDAAPPLDRCLVYCRLRPSNPRDFEDGGFPLISVRARTVTVKDERNYEFDGTFGADSRQEQIFDVVGRPCVQHAFKGLCSALLCYGQTGTGKSFTMCCTKPGIEGLIPRSAQLIFENVGRDASRKYTVTAQFLQIYRDQLGDLMVEPPAPAGGAGAGGSSSSAAKMSMDRVDIRHDNSEGVTFPGCTTHELKSPADFMAMYNEGNKRRITTATLMNPESSRGHSALVVWIKSEPVDEGDCGSRFTGKITFIDLAGYERFSKTGVSANLTMKEEAKTINASLLALGTVVSSLSNGDKHIPWRNSKLTRMLQDSVGGRSRTSIILTVGPSSEHFHETTITLQFGMRAMAVRVEAKVAVSVDYEKLAAKLQLMLDEKDKQISALEIQVAANAAERQEMIERQRRDLDSLKKRQEELLEEMQVNGASAEKLLDVSKMFSVEMESLVEQQAVEAQLYEESTQSELLSAMGEEEKRAQRQRAAETLKLEQFAAAAQAKLSEARGGADKDLEDALAQLAQRDKLLVARSTEIGRMHALCDALAQQVTQLGGEPDIADVELPRTTLDISQFEEVQLRHKNELQAKQQQLVELRVRIEQLTAIAAGRGEEVAALTDRLSRSEQQLAEARAAALLVQSVDVTAREASPILAAGEEMLIPIAHEQHPEQTRLPDATTLANVHFDSVFDFRKPPVPSSAAVDAVDPLITTPRAMGREESDFSLLGVSHMTTTTTASVQHAVAPPSSHMVDRVVMDSMRAELDAEISMLISRNAALEEEVALWKAAVNAKPPAVAPAGRTADPPVTSANSSFAGQQAVATGNASFVNSSLPPDGDSISVKCAMLQRELSTMATQLAKGCGRAADHSETADIDAAAGWKHLTDALSYKDADIEELLLQLQKRDRELRTAVTQRKLLEGTVDSMRTQLTALGQPVAANPSSALFASNGKVEAGTAVYLTAIRKLHEELHSLRQQAMTAASSSPGRRNDTAAVTSGMASDQSASLLDQLRDEVGQRDRLVSQKDEVLLQQAATIAYLSDGVVALEKQLIQSSLFPCFELDDDLKASAEGRQKEMDLLRAKQAALEQESAAKEDERRRVTSMLDGMRSERSKLAQTSAAAQEALQEALTKTQKESMQAQREAEAQKQAAEREAARLATLEREMRDQTRIMMDAQARLALQQAERDAAESEGSGFFSRLKSRFRK